MADKKKEEKIMEMLASGLKVQEIEEKTGLKKSRIYKIREGMKNAVANEENIEEEYIRDNEDPHDTPPIDPINSENQMVETETKENSEQGNNETVHSGNQETDVNFEDETTQEDSHTDTPSENGKSTPSDAPAEKNSAKPDYLLAIESLAESNKCFIDAIKDIVSFATSESHKSIDQSFLQLNLATKIIEEKAKSFEENAALLKDAAERFKSASVSPIVAESQRKSEDPSLVLHLICAFIIYIICFTSAGYMTMDVVLIVNNVLICCTGLLCAFFLYFARRNSRLAFYSIASIPLPCILYQGYYLTFDLAIAKKWIIWWSVVPIALLVVGLIFFFCKKAKTK